MFLYRTEILLLTKSIHPEELHCWLTWHLYILHFDHIVIFDNESPINMQEVISRFPQNKIEYYLIKGWPNQYKLYNDYLKTTKALWTIALDDDEYLYISDIYNLDISQFIDVITKEYKNVNKFYILWLHLFSKESIEDYKDLFINTHIFYSYEALWNIRKVWPLDNGWGKTLINSEYSYSYSTDNYSAGHIPVCLNSNNTTFCIQTQDFINEEHLYIKRQSFYSDIFIAHYQYKNKKDWEIKCRRSVATHPTATIKNKINVYSNLYRYKNLFKPCPLLKEKLDDYITDK